MTTGRTASQKKNSKTSSTGPVQSQTSGLIGFVGLGIMGSAMSSNMLKAGFQVCGFDPSAPARKNFRASGGRPCKDAGAVAALTQVIIFSLPSPDALMQAAEAVAASARKGLVVIETSTFAIQDKQAARAVLAKKGVVMLDCPLSGTGAQARRKDLTVYSSGPAKVVQQLKPVFEGFAKANYYLGEFGNGM
ncbi:MAG: NAD(P)-dependent oxidoreductase, partial [Hylemonella sp.]